jgi:hypothetical protein
VSGWRTIIRKVLEVFGVMLRIVSGGRVRSRTCAMFPRDAYDLHGMAVLVQKYVGWTTRTFGRTRIPVSWRRVRGNPVLDGDVLTRRDPHWGLIRIFRISIVDTRVPRVHRFILALCLGMRSLLLVDTTTLFLVPLISLAL